MESTQNQKRPKPALLNHQYNIVFTAKASEYVQIWLKGFVLSALTLGIYLPQMITKTRRYLWQHTAFLVAPFKYTGSASGYLQSKIPTLLFLASATGLFVASQLHAHTSMKLPLQLASIFALIATAPIDKFTTISYALNHTNWGGHPIKFEANLFTYFLQWWSGFSLTLLTFGVYYPYWRNRIVKTYINHTSCAGLEMTYTGSTKDLLEDHISHLPGIIFTAGLGGFWLHANIQSYRTANTWIGGDRIGSARGFLGLKGSDYFQMALLGWLLKIGTLFVATPWLRIQNIYFITNRVAFIGNLILPEWDEDKPDPEEWLKHSQSS